MLLYSMIHCPTIMCREHGPESGRPGTGLDPSKMIGNRAEPVKSGREQGWSSPRPDREMEQWSMIGVRNRHFFTHYRYNIAFCNKTELILHRMYA